NRVKSECLYAGGKGIDVSRAIRHLGGDSMALGFIGGHNGRVIVDLLKREGVTSYFTPIAQETRRDIIISTRKQGSQTMLNARGPSVTADEWRSFLTHLRLLELRDAYVVLGGSLPRGVPADAYRQIVALVQRRGAKAILDADGPCLKAGLRAKPFAIKPNLNELRRVTGRSLRTEAEILAAADAMNRAGVEVVMISRGRQGLLMVSRSERYRPHLALRAVPPSVKVRSTVGAGDSTVAGFVFKHAGGKTLEDCVRFATAAGTAATLAPGNQLCRLRDVQRLLPKVKIEHMPQSLRLTASTKNG
ncbi:MAG: 1-phosphofructokinase family hexose kinase, partial [Nitrospirota bacterium]